MAVRVNPDVDAHTHAKITTGTYENKFGIPLEQVEGVYARAARLKNLRWRGVQMHIGSQLTDVRPFVTGGPERCCRWCRAGGAVSAGIFQHRRRPGHRL